MTAELVSRLRDLSNRLRDSGRYAADECDLAAASLIDEAIAALQPETQGDAEDHRDFVLLHILDELENHEGDFTRAEVAAHLRNEVVRLGLRPVQKA